MRILSIRFQNLNSLRGSQELNLESGPLAEAGLFAITGPTGAGKSTILDAVTLALYARAARYGKDSAEEMMSRGAGECSASVEFSCESGRYTARWLLRRSRGKADGNFQPLKHELSQDGVIIEDKTRGVVQKVEELTGLDYDRFLRSVLLAQGQFAAFLRAGKDERADLLERITGSHIYSELGSLAYRIHRGNGEEIERENIRLGSIALLPDEERLAVAQRLSVITGDLASQEQSQARLTAEVACLQRAVKLRGEESALAADSAAHARAVTEFVPQEARLQQHTATLPFAGALRQCDESARTAARAAESENSAAVQLKEARGSAARAAALSLAALAAGESSASAARATTEKHRTEVSAKIAAARQWLEAAGMPSGDADNVQSDLVRLTQLRGMLERCARTQTVLERQQSELASLVAEIERLKTNAATRAAAAKTSEEGLAAARREESLLQELARGQQLVRSLTEHRSHLQAGEPCPLCGATEHPFATGAPDSSSAEVRLKAQQTTVKQAEKIAAAAARESSAAQNALAAADAKSLTLHTALESGWKALAAEWSTQFPDVPWPSRPQESAAIIAQAQEKADKNHARLSELHTRLRDVSALERQEENCRHELEKAERDARLWAGDRRETEEAILDAGITPAGPSAAEVAWNKARPALTRSLSEFHVAAKLLGAADSTAAATAAAARAAEENLAAALAGSAFSSIAALRAAQLDDATLHTLTAHRDTLRATGTRLETRSERLAAEWAALHVDYAPPLPPADSLPALQTSLATLTAEMKTLQAMRGALQQQLDTDDAARTRHAAAATELENRKLAASPWARLAELIGSADGDKFSRYAQSITLDHLIALANVRLTQLCARYRLLRCGAASDLTLQISDAWQADAVRPMESLSGGETFLVSLALALGLSELAGRRTRIGTLFIDEGFGTLDSTALDIALSSLEGLRTGHSTIGIISHVEALKARLTTQVEVVRGASGWSRLEVRV